MNLSHKSSSSSQRRQLTVDEYYEGVRSGDVAVLARALTLIESSQPRQQLITEELLARLLPDTGGSIRVGITGVPGVGKSTFIESLGQQLVRAGKRVAVLAVDPSSDISGGSILGDKTRMPQLATHPAAYIRPSPSGQTHGGVARKTRESMLVCEAAGYDVVLIETVGVGQSETMVANMTDCFLALMLPGAGDELQGIKRGLLELVDIIAVNKADGTNKAAAKLAAQQYSIALHSLSRHAENNEAPQVFTCSALNDQGVNTLWDAINQCHERLATSGKLIDRRRQQDLRWLWSVVEEGLRQQVRTHSSVQIIRDQLEHDVVTGIITPEAAASRILEAFLT